MSLDCDYDVVFCEDGREVKLAVGLVNSTLYDEGKIVAQGRWIEIRKTALDRFWLLKIMGPKEYSEIMRMLRTQAVELGWEVT